MRVVDDIRVIISGPGACEQQQPLLQAMRAEGWDCSVVEDLRECANSALSGACHMVVVAARDPESLSRDSVRLLMNLRVDIPVHFLVPNHWDKSASRVLAGATSDQIHKSACAIPELMEVLREDLRRCLLQRARYTVMYVDDDREFLASLEAFLPGRLRKASSQFELEFEFFDEPLVAVDFCQKIGDRLAVVVSDQVMPNLAGIQLLARVKAMHPRARRVLLTGHAGLDSAVTAINQHVLHKYIFKPVDPVDFSETVRLLLSEYHLSLRAETRQERLMSQFEYIREVTSARKPAQVLASTLSFLTEQLGAAQVQVALVQDNQLALKAATRDSGAGPVSLEGGIWGWLAKHKRSVCAAAAGELPQDVGPGLPMPIMAAPLLRDDAFLGAVVVWGGHCGNGFSREATMLLNFVADIAAVAIGSFGDRDELEKSYVSTMASLMETVEAKDSYTRGHTERVRIFAIELARSLGIKEQLLQQIEWAAALHDIGKISMPDAILQKPGSLTAHEYAVMKAHTTRADRILRHLKCLRAARIIVRSHHERYDGAGYPDGLAGEEIPLGARILAIADSYDAMTSARPYRMAMDQAEAFRRIEAASGTQFDPRLAQKFLEMMRSRKDPIVQAIVGDSCETEIPGHLH